MGKLIVTDGSGKTQDFPLDKERVTIGRHPDNDISLNDKAVSGHHAVVITILQDSFLEDLDSTNGTQVNSKQIAKHPLSHGDVISIGRNTLKYENEQSADDDFEKTMILKPGSTPGQVGVTSSFGSLGGATIGPASIKVLTGAAAGREVALTKVVTTLGKPGVQVASITKRPTGYVFAHVEGGQRPTVNGIPLTGESIALRSGDLIELAGTQMQFVQG